MRLEDIAPYRKAIAAFFVALAAALSATSATDGLSGGELAVSVIGALATGLSTYATPNAAPRERG